MPLGIQEIKYKRKTSLANGRRKLNGSINGSGEANKMTTSGNKRVRMR